MTAGPITPTEIDDFAARLERLPTAAPRPLRQPASQFPRSARGLADRVRARVHTVACWVVVWTAPTDERARF